MVTTTLDRASGLGTQRTGKGLLRRMADRYIEAQIRKAELRVNAYLQSLDDKALSKMGYTAAQIRDIRGRDASVSAYI